MRGSAALTALLLAIGLVAAPAAAAGTKKAAHSAAAGNGSGGAGFGGSSAPGPKAKAPKKKAKKTAIKPAGGSRHLGDRVLREGMSGHDVRVLQAYLSLAGYPTSVDGGFGPLTVTSVIAFERAAGFNANGVVTVPVEVALRNKVKAVEADPPSGPIRINGDGTATAPANAPTVVKNVVAAANQIINQPYVYGGGHASFISNGYDCSGAVSFALHGGGLLSSPEDSTDLESWGASGPGKWITVYADSGHAFMVVDGRAFDTADFGGPNIPGGSGPRWRSNPTGNLSDGGDYVVRHYPGY